MRFWWGTGTSLFLPEIKINTTTQQTSNKPTPQNFLLLKTRLLFFTHLL
jgi:hypothetical protein